jgi:hypothetical protein
MMNWALFTDACLYVSTWSNRSASVWSRNSVSVYSGSLAFNHCFEDRIHVIKIWWCHELKYQFSTGTRHNKYFDGWMEHVYHLHDNRMRDLFRHSQEIFGHLRWSVEIHLSHFDQVNGSEKGHIRHSYLPPIASCERRSRQKNELCTFGWKRTINCVSYFYWDART